MTTRTLLAAVATAALAAVVTPSLSFAQDTTTKTSKGEVAMSAPNFGSLISAINASAKHNAALKAMTTVNATDVQLVNVADLLKGNDASALDAALTKNQSDIDALRSTLGANTTINTVITGTAAPGAAAADAKLSASDVVAADVGANGKVTLYYWKKPA